MTHQLPKGAVSYAFKLITNEHKVSPGDFQLPIQVHSRLCVRQRVAPVPPPHSSEAEWLN